MAVVGLLVLMVSGASTSLKEHIKAVPTSCGPCVALDHVWCYHDDTCYAHGDGNDAKPFSCPGTSNCAASDCDCKTCGEKKCKQQVPNAASCDANGKCGVANQYCPPQSTGSSDNGFCCNGGVWKAGICNPPPDSNPAITNVEQVHIAYGLLPTEVTVAWVSNVSTAIPVNYGLTDKGLTSSAASNVRQLNVSLTPSGNGERYTLTATLTNLVDGETYAYKIADRAFEFTLRRAFIPGTVSIHIIFGDMGTTHAFSLCQACTASNAVCDAAACEAAVGNHGLIEEVKSADMMLHVGDFAYNFDSGSDGFIGDQFMRNIEQVASKVPYMTTHGNHEDSPADLAHYVERFRNMPANSDQPTFTTKQGPGAGNNMYFSWDAGLVHYISLSTEFWFGVSSFDKKVTTATQLEWLEKDLIAANANRANVPWVVAQGHRDIYCSTSDDSDCGAGQAGVIRADLEPLFFKYGLDLWINGHEHSYERTYPMYKGESQKCPGSCPERSNNCLETCTNPNATIYIITGAAGSPEMHEGFDNAQPSWSAYRSNTFGYSRLLVHNATHIRWQEVQTDPTLFPTADYGRVIDDVWIIQEKHGPFDLATAPKGKAWPIGDETPSRAFDHWGPLLGLDKDGTDKRATVALIREFREIHGDKAWAEKEDELLRYVNDRIGGASEWEDVRGDGSSSGAWFRWKDQSLEDVARVMRR